MRELMSAGLFAVGDEYGFRHRHIAKIDNLIGTHRVRITFTDGSTTELHECKKAVVLLDMSAKRIESDMDIETDCTPPSAFRASRSRSISYVPSGADAWMVTIDENPPVRVCHAKGGFYVEGYSEVYRSLRLAVKSLAMRAED